MISIFNQFVNWFLKQEGDTAVVAHNPLALMQRIGDVNLLIAEPSGKFLSEEIKNNYLQALVVALAERPGLSVRLNPKSFKRETKGTLDEQFKSALTEGRALLQAEQCDLLLWGHVENDLQAVRWYFISTQSGAAELGVPGFAESLLVPFEAEKPVLDVLYAALFAACVASHPTHAAKIGEHLLNGVEPLTKLSPVMISRKAQPLVQASIMAMASVVLANIARRARELGWFDPALKSFKAWEEIAQKDKNSVEWALVANHYAWLYEEMATHNEDAQRSTHIDLAITRFEEIAAIFAEKRYLLEWAAVQLRIAGICARTGRILSDAEYLQRAIKYYRRAMDVYTKKKYPLNWAETMSKMAKTLMLHGQMVRGAQSLEQAGVTFQATLTVYTQEKYPALWANTQNNLGATLFALAKRDPSTVTWIEHALLCFEAARSYYGENGKTQMVHVIDKNITRAQKLKDQIEEDLQNNLLE